MMEAKDMVVNIRKSVELPEDKSFLGMIDFTDKVAEISFKAGRKEERERIDTVKDKAIEVIEYLTCNDDFGMSDSLECKLLTKIYCLAHVARGHCLNPHEDWAKELEDMWQALRGEK